MYYSSANPNAEFIYISVGRNSSVGIATGYRLDGTGIESRSGRDFPHLSKAAHNFFSAHDDPLTHILEIIYY